LCVSVEPSGRGVAPGEGRKSRGRKGGKQQDIFLVFTEEGWPQEHGVLPIPTVHSREKQPPMRHAALTCHVLMVFCKGEEKVSYRWGKMQCIRPHGKGLPPEMSSVFLV